MTREPEQSAFDAIVASWRAEGDVPEWPDDPLFDAPDLPGAELRDLDRDPFEPGSDKSDDPRRADQPGAHGGRSDIAPRAGGPDATPEYRPDAASGHRPGAGRPGAMPDDDRSDIPRSAARPDAMPDAERPAAPGDRSGADRPDNTPGHHLGGDWPDTTPDAERSDATPGDRSGADRPDKRVRPTDRDAPPAADPLAEEHYVPPEPPPLPRMGPPIIVGLTLIGLGLVLVSFPGWVGVPQVYGLPLGLVAIAAGLGWLVLRLWPDPDDVPPPLYLDDPDDPDGGAVL